MTQTTPCREATAIPEVLDLAAEVVLEIPIMTV
jgi:hypothetical protein